MDKIEQKILNYLNHYLDTDKMLRKNLHDPSITVAGLADISKQAQYNEGAIFAFEQMLAIVKLEKENK